MEHFTMDGFKGFRSRFDDVRLIHELLEEIPDTLGLQAAMPPFILPYYNGVVPEDCGVSAFLFLAGGHFTLHTFSFREVFFADLVYPSPFDERRLRYLLEAGFPCETTTVHHISRAPGKLKDRPVNPETDFGPHVFLDFVDYAGPQDLDSLFTLFDTMPGKVGMTPIMRPYVVRNVTADGREVVSAMTMIAESHISLHVFPAERKAYLDVFSCRFFDREVMVRELRALFPGEVTNDALVARGSAYTALRSEREAQYERSKAWLSVLRSDASQRR